MRKLFALGLAAIFVAANISTAQDTKPASKPAVEKKVERTFVVMKTSEGDIELELFDEQAPLTVKNFVGLAEGTREFKGRTGEMTKRPYYDGLKFHRIIPNFMIQGGCPEGNGTGGPGFKYKDEINPNSLGLDKIQGLPGGRPHQNLMIRTQPQMMKLRKAVVEPIFADLGISSEADFKAKKKEFDARLAKVTLADALTGMGYEYDYKLKSSLPKRGTLALANSGPNTNGSQFFICTKDSDYLAGKHTVFGRVTKGMDVVDKIGKMGSQQGTPTKPVKIITLRKGRLPAAPKATPTSKPTKKPASKPTSQPAGR